MANKTRMEEIAERLQRGENKQLDPRESILQNISKGGVIPVISSSFRIEQIFQELEKEIGPNIVEGLIKEWARFIKYPMPDSSQTVLLPVQDRIMQSLKKNILFDGRDAELHIEFLLESPSN